MAKGWRPTKLVHGTVKSIVLSIDMNCKYHQVLYPDNLLFGIHGSRFGFRAQGRQRESKIVAEDKRGRQYHNFLLPSILIKIWAEAYQAC